MKIHALHSDRKRVRALEKCPYQLIKIEKSTTDITRKQWLMYQTKRQR